MRKAITRAFRDCRNDLALEWERDSLRLLLTIGNQSVTYIRFHDSRPLEETDGGRLETPERLEQLIEWILTANRYDYEKRPCFGDPERFSHGSSSECPSCKWRNESEVVVITGAR